MKNKKILFLVLSLAVFIVPATALALDVSFNNPVGTAGSITEFFQAVMQGILNIIAFLAVLFIVIAGVIYLMASTSGNDNLITTAKKIWTGSLIGLALSLAAPSFLREIKEIVLDGGEMPTDLDTALSLTDIVSNTLAFLLSTIGIIAIISLVINGILYLSAAGNSAKAEKIKTNISYSLLGFLLAGSALILVKEVVKLIETF